LLPDCWSTVGAALAVAEEKQLTATIAAKWIHDEDTHPRPVILAVDEVGHLSVGDDGVIGALLSGMSELITALYRLGRKAIGLVTALPNAAVKSLTSNRLVTAVELPVFTEEESSRFLTDQCPSLEGTYELAAILSFCGNHPRSLAIAAEYYNFHRTMPTPQFVASSCNWKSDQSPELNDIVTAMKESYETLAPGDGPAFAKLLRAAVVIKRDDGKSVIPPTVFWCDWKNNEGPPDPSYELYFLTRMFFWRLPRKQLESVNLSWDFFRCQYKMAVVPPLMKVESADADTKREIHTLKFSFLPVEDSHKLTGAVLGQKAGSCLLNLVDADFYYQPKAHNHRGIESMCVAKAENGTEYLCLFQSKINAEAADAFSALNQAAKDLSGIWKDGRKFLFIAYALDAKRPDYSKSAHPVVLINEANLDTYFTPTLARAVQLQLALHKHSYGKVTAARKHH
jgi:hypothetical protein